MTNILLNIAEQLQEVQRIGITEATRDLSPEQKLKLAADLSPMPPLLYETIATLALAEFDGDGENRLYTLSSGLIGAAKVVCLEWLRAGRPPYFEPFVSISPGIRGEIHGQIQEFRGLASGCSPREIEHFLALVKVRG